MDIYIKSGILFNAKKGSDYMQNFLGLFSNLSNNTLLLINTAVILIVGKIIISIIKKVLVRLNNNKIQYRILNFTKIVIHIIEILLIYLLWENNIKNVITVISFVSAAITLSLKDLVFNLFAGIYIKMSKPFVIEDRIEIDGVKGDVIGINAFTFELLEVDNNYGNQSTGVVLIIPNSTVIIHTLKNLNKGFKNIWDEINVTLELDANVEASKKILYRIINQVDTIKSLPKKTSNEIRNNTSYRMYYNKFDPVIYTNVKDSHIELKLRYLVNPKQARIVESKIWNDILEEYKNGNIKLYKG